MAVNNFVKSCCLMTSFKINMFKSWYLPVFTEETQRPAVKEFTLHFLTCVFYFLCAAICLVSYMTGIVYQACVCCKHPGEVMKVHGAET